MMPFLCDKKKNTPIKLMQVSLYDSAVENGGNENRKKCEIKIMSKTQKTKKKPDSCKKE